MNIYKNIYIYILRGMYSTRRVDARIVASEKCWSGIEEKMPEISREVN